MADRRTTVVEAAPADQNTTVVEAAPGGGEAVVEGAGASGADRRGTVVEGAGASGGDRRGTVVEDGGVSGGDRRGTVTEGAGAGADRRATFSGAPPRRTTTLNPLNANNRTGTQQSFGGSQATSTPIMGGSDTWRRDPESVDDDEKKRHRKIKQRLFGLGYLGTCCLFLMYIPLLVAALMALALPFGAVHCAKTGNGPLCGQYAVVMPVKSSPSLVPTSTRKTTTTTIYHAGLTTTTIRLPPITINKPAEPSTPSVILGKPYTTTITTTRPGP